MGEKEKTRSINGFCVSSSSDHIIRLDLVLLPRLLIYLEVSVFDIAEFVATPRRCRLMASRNLPRLGSPRILFRGF
jgi:hypothetical protein